MEKKNNYMSTDLKTKKSKKQNQGNLNEKIKSIQHQLVSVSYRLPVAGAREEVVGRLLNRLHACADLGLGHLKFGVLLREEVTEEKCDRLKRTR